MSNKYIVKTAILVDGGFYRRRAQTFLGEKTAAERAKELSDYCYRHLTRNKYEISQLHKIFYYDCPPINKKIYHPLLKKTIDLGKSELYTWTEEFFNQLKKQRKFALRLGKLAEEQAKYVLKPDITKKLCSGSLTIDQLKENDFTLSIEQKGVDMKIGIDIASLSYKQQVDRIILISGDSDFVPSAKLARKEGIDFVLDPLFSNIKPDLFEHIDGLMSKDKRFNPNNKIKKRNPPLR